MEDARKAIEVLVQQFMDAFKKGDATAVAGLYAEDAKLLPPHTQMTEGREAIRSFWQGAMDKGIKEAQLEIVEVEAQGNMAYEMGKYTLVIELEDGTRLIDTGKYVVIWKQIDREWKLAVDIWNTDIPEL